ncbi:keratin, type I cytoskeletal 14-like [Brachyistius frenatus]|uniref:keratin, type I cytoskeletal 14-like n=1 Tax=Brachyistius frenatus TaxID=100188 RepID=UPI0037E846D0
MASTGSSSSDDLKDEAAESLRTLLDLYEQHDAAVQEAAERFVNAAAGVVKNPRRGVEGEGLRVLLAMTGGAVGAASGGLTGGLWAAVGATTFCWFRRDVTAVGVTFGLFGGVLGGAVGGAVSGLVGGTVEASAAAAGWSVRNVSVNALWFAAGFVTGGAIGGAFGGSVGSATGAIGGGLGALQAAYVTTSLIRKVVYFCPPEKAPEETSVLTEKLTLMRKSGEDLRGSLVPLVEQLESVQNICSKTGALSVAGRTARTLTAVTSMEERLSDSWTAADLMQFVSRLIEAMRGCEETLDELKKTRAEVERRLSSWRPTANQQQ